AKVPTGRGKDQRSNSQDPGRRSGAFIYARLADKGIFAGRLRPGPRRISGRETKKALQRGSHVASAQGALQGNDNATRRSSGPAQKADRRARTIWRLQMHL